MGTQLAGHKPCKFHRGGEVPEGSVAGSELIPEGSLEEENLEGKKERGCGRELSTDRRQAILPALSGQGRAGQLVKRGKAVSPHVPDSSIPASKPSSSTSTVISSSAKKESKRKLLKEAIQIHCR